MTRYWMAVASKEHVQRGKSGGFAQVCHGKKGPLAKMREGDWLIYYSPTVTFGKKAPCQAFTAIGRVATSKPYPFEMSPDFIPWRINVNFEKAQEAAMLHNLRIFVSDAFSPPRLASRLWNSYPIPSWHSQSSHLIQHQALNYRFDLLILP